MVTRPNTGACRPIRWALRTPSRVTGIVEVLSGCDAVKAFWALRGALDRPSCESHSHVACHLYAAPLPSVAFHQLYSSSTIRAPFSQILVHGNLWLIKLAFDFIIPDIDCGALGLSSCYHPAQFESDAPSPSPALPSFPTSSVTPPKSFIVLRPSLSRHTH